MKGHPVNPGASWIELCPEAFAQNLAFVIRAASDATQQAPRIGVVLKGNAYGHGLEAMARLLKEHAAVEVVYVISCAEALTLRSCGVTSRIIILGAYPGDLARAAAGEEQGFEWVASSFYQIQQWRAAAPHLKRGLGPGRVKVHVHVDSGLGREGFLPGEVDRAAEALCALDFVQIVGVMTHFANTEDVTRQDYAEGQIEQFEASARALEAAFCPGGGARLERHMAATAAALLLPRARADVVRLGIGIYGLWPSDSARLSYRMRQTRTDGARSGAPSVDNGAREQVELGLVPVLSWRVLSQCVKTLDQGSYVGYGCTFRCERRTRIAVFPVGYFDGFPRLMTSRAYVLVDGVRCPVIGRVMMNHIVVDVTGCRKDLREPLLATLIGQDGDQSITAEDHAHWSDTINYEVVTRIGPHLERRVVTAAQVHRGGKVSKSCGQKISVTNSPMS